MSANLYLDGQCRCGQVRMQIVGPPLLTAACHCTGCRRMTASAFSLSAAIQSENFAVTKGEPVIGGLHGPTRHFFCAYCMSWLFTRPEGFDWLVNVRSTMLEDSRWSAPFIETWTSEKLPWALSPAVHSFVTVPPFDQYERLMTDYASWRADL
ncbi:MAG: GFA family protein [Hyphomicrobiales bacterium]